MRLSRIGISHFRGIKKLTLYCLDEMVLIGENQWGKRSLYDALTLFLSPNNAPHALGKKDFHYINDNEQANTLTLSFSFSQTKETVTEIKKLPIWVSNRHGSYYLRYVVTGSNKSAEITTTHQFLGDNDVPLELSQEQVFEYLAVIKRYYPIIFLKDLRNNMMEIADKPLPKMDSQTFHQHLNQVIKPSSNEKNQINQQQLAYYVQGVQHILARYFGLFGHDESEQTRSICHNQWHMVNQFGRMVSGSEDKNAIGAILLKLVVSALLNRDNVQLAPNAQPVLLIEDMGGRFHPIMMSAAWALIAQLPIQKITATNSSEMLTLVPLENIIRLEANCDGVTVYQLDRLNAVDMRKLAFHIQFNRAASLFARGWILVEGETEVWLLTEIARQFGYQLETEGIKVIEFAQCGLEPLIRYASEMGIEWHVLTDGDDAGQKYAYTTVSFAKKNNDKSEDRLTLLPNKDIEYFLYKHGFSDVYKRASHLREYERYSTGRVISQAINRSSKPDLAIEIVEEMRRRGLSSVPNLFRQLFSTIITLINRKK